MKVWVLLEFPVGKPNERSLYGVFSSEKAAREDYGEIRYPYDIQVVECKVFGS